ncbi:hypothetical protein E4U41_000781 [Claviceps citrina]|nr:hypothetical protein E4U41_000781 [Claviceps citrina]
MLLKAFLPVLFTATALASPVVRVRVRDDDHINGTVGKSPGKGPGNAITNSLYTINQDLQALDRTLTSFSGGLLSALPILAAASKLEFALGAGSLSVRGSQPLSQDQALDVAGSVTDLASETKKTIDHLVGQKPAFDKLLVVTPIARSIVKRLREGTDRFAGEVIQKVPEEMRATARGLVEGIDADFERGIEALGQGGGWGGWGGGGSWGPGLWGGH